MSSDIASRLSEQTKGLVSRFEGRVTRFRGRDDLLQLLRPLDGASADEHAREYFGLGEHTAIGIDGSRAFDERLQMMLFYANATGYSCPFRVGEDISFDLAHASRAGRLSASAAIPLWAEDFSDVLPETPEVDLEIEHSMERIPNSFMVLAELYLATGALDGSRVIFMDRPLSGTYSSLARDARLLMRKGSTNLEKLPGVGHAGTLLDLSLSLNLGAPFMTMPNRRRFSPHRIIKALIEEGELSRGGLGEKLGLDDRALSAAAKSLKRYDDDHDGALLEDAGPGRIRLRKGVEGYWSRSADLARAYAERVYAKGEPPLSVGEDEWLTILDVNTVSLVLLLWLCEQSMARNVLLIGLAKDTTATDIHRSVLPFAIKKGFVNPRTPPPILKNDRAFLSILSAMNRDLKTPWRTSGYDSAFSTMVATIEGEFVPARKVVSREEVFVRGFFQSRSLGNNDRIRSQVFLFDRLFDAEKDSADVDPVEVRERAGKTRVSPYYEGGETSTISNLVLRILALTDNPEVYEAFGHNQLLYLADKAVKSEIRLMRNSLRAVADLRLGSITKREQVYGIMTPYRDQRASSEATRMREASRSD